VNLGTHLARSARLAPDTPALGDGTRTRTYRELDDRVSRLAAGLLGEGLESGDRVAILMANRPELLETIYACFRAGMVAVPINSRLHPDEVRYIVSHAGARAIIVGPEYEASARDSGAGLLFRVGDEYESLISRAEPGFVDRDVASDTPAWLFYTSGTTGRPKGATLSHGNLLAMVMACLANVTDYRASDIVLHAAPLTHGAGLYALAATARGACHVVPPTPPFDPVATLELVGRLRATVVSFVTPTMVRLLLDAAASGTADLRSLRAIVYGGGPMYAEDLRRAQTTFGLILTQIYGLGETPMTVSYLPATVPAREAEQLASVGVAHPSVELRLLDESGLDVPVGEMGEVCVRSAAVMRGYWNDPEATGEVLKDGWLHTGDIGRLDASGYLYLLDRKKDMIVSGGSNIYPREVEEVLIVHPAVASVAVIGTPDRHWGESVHAVVVLEPGASVTAAELIAFCESRIASYKKPRTVEFVSELPVSGVGKVLKRELRERWLTARAEAGR
jgi:acyl-CoA synthetase (AMP-forming)/AMP-acid ligase II